MYNALNRVLGDAAFRQALADAGRARAEQHFELEQMVRQYESVYLDLASQKCRGLVARRDAVLERLRG
jgi:glycosyltransferase involved in cell wall biosynthesis